MSLEHCSLTSTVMPLYLSFVPCSVERPLHGCPIVCIHLLGIFTSDKQLLNHVILQYDYEMEYTQFKNIIIMQLERTSSIFLHLLVYVIYVLLNMHTQYKTRTSKSVM